MPHPYCKDKFGTNSPAKSPATPVTDFGECAPVGRNITANLAPYAVTVPGQLTRYYTQLFWNKTAYVTDSSGNNTSTEWGYQNPTDMVFTTLTSAQQAAVNLTYATVDATTGSVGAHFDFIPYLPTPISPTRSMAIPIWAGTPEH